MKKITTFLAIITLVLAFAGCTETNDETDPTPTATATQVTARINGNGQEPVSTGLTADEVRKIVSDEVAKAKSEGDQLTSEDVEKIVGDAIDDVEGVSEEDIRDIIQEEVDDLNLGDRGNSGDDDEEGNGDDPTPTSASNDGNDDENTGDNEDTNGNDDDSSNNASNGNGSASAPVSCEFPAPGNLNNMPKTKIELFDKDVWTHRVFNEREFHAPEWNGADSWFVTLAVGDNNGGAWTSHGNPGEVIYRQTDTSASWCLGMLTTSSMDGQNLKDQFLSNADTSLPAQVSVKVAHDAFVNIWSSTGNLNTDEARNCTTIDNGGVRCQTSDQGDITIVLPDDGQVRIWTDYNTDAPTFEAVVKWGPFDRSENINTVNAR